jgi:hypothetical protein
MTDKEKWIDIANKITTAIENGDTFLCKYSRAFANSEVLHGIDVDNSSICLTFCSHLKHHRIEELEDILEYIKIIPKTEENYVFVKKS